MRPGFQRLIAAATIRLSGLTIILILCGIPLFAVERHQGAIVFREEVSAARRDELAQKLRPITGWTSLSFDGDGSLVTGPDRVEAGSQSARVLITSALAGDKVLILEDASNRADVVFAKVVPGRWLKSSSDSRPAFVVLIDFADFDHLMGDRQALEAFNVGWSVLHEIDHVVNDSVDAESPGQAGECEDHLNQMRRECHLPARLDYFFRYFPNAEQSDFRTRLVRLAFAQDEGAKKHRRLWVIWDATQVGGLESAKQIATLRSSQPSKQHLPLSIRDLSADGSLCLFRLPEVSELVSKQQHKA